MAFIDDIVLFGIVGVAALFVMGGGLGKLGIHVGGDGGGGKEKKGEYGSGGGGKGHYVGSPGYYTSKGHHHCNKGTKGCVCTDSHKCKVGSNFVYEVCPYC